MAYGNDPALLPPPAPPTSRSTSATGVDTRPSDRLCRRLALVTDVTTGTAIDVCASPVDGRRVIHAFLSAGPVVEVRLLRDSLGPLVGGSDASYGRYFMLGYNGNSHLPNTDLHRGNFVMSGTVYEGNSQEWELSGEGTVFRGRYSDSHC